MSGTYPGAEQPRSLGNRYELGSVLGRGGMAEVFMARDTRLGRTVAVKTLRADLSRDPTFQARFRREAQSAASLNHPAIVAIYDTGEDFENNVSVPYIVMEYADGSTLRDLLHLMIIVSDNAATDIILEAVGGPAAVTATMRELGLNGIRVDRTIGELLAAYFTALDPGLDGMVYGQWKAREDAIPGLKERSENVALVRDAVAVATAGHDLATPRDMARLNAMIAKNECASPESCAGMLEILGRQQFNGRLPRHLPPFQKLPHKTGTLGAGAVVNDAGLLYFAGEPVAALAVFCREMRDPIYATETRLAQIGRTVWDHYAAKS